MKIYKRLPPFTDAQITFMAAAFSLFALVLPGVATAQADPFPSTNVTNGSPTTQKCEQTDATHQTCFVSNPPLPSGKGGAFGPNHGLQSNIASPGYKLEYASFVLSGPHPCNGDDFSPKTGPGGVPWGVGSWANCWQISRTSDHVVWGYTLKGVQGGEVSIEPTWDHGPGIKGSISQDGVIHAAARLTLIYAKIPQSKDK